MHTWSLCCTNFGWRCLAIASLTGLLTPITVSAQLPTWDQLPSSNQLFLRAATKAFRWEEPTPPVHIVGPIHFVGTAGLGSYLITTTEGHILFNTGMPSSGPMIVQSIRQLGFDPREIKILINSHAHLDHCGAMAYMQEHTGAKLYVMREDVRAMEDGGKDDFHYGRDWRDFGFPPAKVDHVLRDGQRIKLENVLLTAHHTPGHTRGATTWEAQVVHEGKLYTVLWPDGAGFNPGYRLAKNPSYPGITADYRRTLHKLEMFAPDIWLAGHCEWFDLAGKRDRVAKEGVAAWVDPEGYRRWVASKRRAFEDQLDRELTSEGAAPQ